MKCGVWSDSGPVRIPGFKLIGESVGRGGGIYLYRKFLPQMKKCQESRPTVLPYTVSYSIGGHRTQAGRSAGSRQHTRIFTLIHQLSPFSLLQMAYRLTRK